MTKISEVTREQFDAIGEQRETITLTVWQWELVRRALLMAVANGRDPQAGKARYAIYQEIVAQGAAQAGTAAYNRLFKADEAAGERAR